MKRQAGPAVLALILLGLASAFGQQPAPATPSSSPPRTAQAPAPATPPAPVPPSANQPATAGAASQAKPPAPAPGAPGAAPRTVVPPPAIPRPTLLLAYWPAEQESDQALPFVDTIAIVDGHKLIDPWARTSDIPGEINKWIPHFDRTFFPKGRVYEVYEGGQRTDAGTVLRPQSITCDSLSAVVKLSGPGPARKALAGGHPRDLHANWQKPPSEPQREVFLQLAQELLAPAGVAASQVRVVNLVSTRLDEFGPPLLVGDASGGSQRVFLIAEAQRHGGYKIAISSLHDTDENGTDSGEHEEFLDQLDITGDGVDEIITLAWYYESWDYNIYQRNARGEWEKLYNGGGGGC